MKPFRIACLLAAASVLGACLQVADDRARRDQRVGRASQNGLSVVVDDGLAAVRALQTNALTLWAQAPQLAFSLSRTDGDPPLTLAIENALPDAELHREGGTVVPPLPAEPGAPATLRRWNLDVAANARFLLLAPDRDRRETFRFAAFADVQERLEDVQDIYRLMSFDPTIRFAIMNGDLTDMGSIADLLQFQREMRTLRFPVFATLGNHELGTAGPPFQDLFGRASFSFDFRGARFTLLDSASATLSPLVYTWLDGWLRDGAGAFHLVTMHIPPLDPIGVRNGGFASRLEAHQLLGRLAASGVDLTIYGHVHSYYAFANAGIDAYISGGGGGIPERMDGIARHYLTVDVDPASQRFQVAVVRVD
jgi:3',5'-cyclic-AMP phosphodiesterase